MTEHFLCVSQAGPWRLVTPFPGGGPGPDRGLPHLSQLDPGCSTPGIIQAIFILIQIDLEMCSSNTCSLGICLWPWLVPAVGPFPSLRGPLSWGLETHICALPVPRQNTVTAAF